MAGENRDGGEWRPKAGEGPVEAELKLTETVSEAIGRMEAEIAELKKLPLEGPGATSEYHIDNLQKKLDKLREQSTEGGQ